MLIKKNKKHKRMSLKKFRNDESREVSDDTCCEMYVGNYPSTFGKKELFKIFQEYDIVKVRKLFKKENKVFAFVQFKSRESMKKAVKELSDYDIQGRKLKLYAVEGKKENNKGKFRNNTYDELLIKGSYESLRLDHDGPPPLEHDGPPPLEYDGPPPLEHDGPPPLEHDEPPPLEHDGPPPLEHDEPPPLEHDGPPPLEHDGPPPLEHDGPPPLEHDRPPPLEYDGPPPLEYVGLLPLERVNWRKQLFHQLINFRQKNSRLSPSKYHCSVYYPEQLQHDYVFPTVINPCLAYRRKPLSNELSSISNNDGYLVKDQFEECTLISIMNFPCGTTQQDILQLFDLFQPLDVELVINAPMKKRPFSQALVLLPTMKMAEAAVMELDNTWFKKQRIRVSIVEKNKYQTRGLLEEYKYSKRCTTKSLNDNFAELSLHH